MGLKAQIGSHLHTELFALRRLYKETFKAKQELTCVIIDWASVQGIITPAEHRDLSDFAARHGLLREMAWL